MMILYLILFAIIGIALDLGNLEFLFWVFYGITFIISLIVEMEIARMPENDEEYNENKEEINN